MMDIRPLHNYIVVRPNRPSTVRPSGLELPERSVGFPTSGTVIRVGPRVRDVAVHDEVHFFAHSGWVCEDGDEVYYIMRESAVTAIVSNPSSTCRESPIEPAWNPTDTPKALMRATTQRRVVPPSTGCGPISAPIEVGQSTIVEP